MQENGISSQKLDSAREFINLGLCDSYVLYHG